MQKWALLVAGGVFGTMTRYLLTGIVQRCLGSGFPFGTLVVNILGCFVAGMLSAGAEQKFTLTSNGRLFWMTGLLGAMTTFSALIYESWRLIQGGDALLASVNLLGSVALGLMALWAGHQMVTLF